MPLTTVDTTPLVRVEYCQLHQHRDVAWDAAAPRTPRQRVIANATRGAWRDVLALADRAYPDAPGWPVADPARRLTARQFVAVCRDAAAAARRRAADRLPRSAARSWDVAQAAVWERAAAIPYPRNRHLL